MLGRSVRTYPSDGEIYGNYDSVGDTCEEAAVSLPYLFALSCGIGGYVAKFGAMYKSTKTDRKSAYKSFGRSSYLTDL